MVSVALPNMRDKKCDMRDKNATCEIKKCDMRDIEDITCPRVDINFIFEWSTRYLTSERSERVRYQVEHEKIKLICLDIECLRAETRKREQSVWDIYVL